MTRITVSPRKLSFSFLALFTLLLAVVSIAFGTIGSSASGVNKISDVLAGTKKFSFRLNNITTFFNGENAVNTTETPDDKIKNIKESPVFTEFESWINEYKSKNFNDLAEHNKAGEKLAIERQKVFKELSQLDPKLALEKAISSENYKILPSFVTKYSEKPISAYGDLYVYISDDIDPATKKLTGSHTEREVVIGKSRYKAIVYGRREAMTTKLNIPLQGVMTDDVMIVDENPFRQLKTAEYESRAVDSAKMSEQGVVSEIGGELRYFSNQEEFENLFRGQIEWESKIGPERPQENLAPEETASSWTEGPKTVLVIRVDFSDKPGDPLDVENQRLTQSRAQSLFASEINPFYVNSSYNKTSMQATVTPLLRMPQPQSNYSSSALLTDARNAASAAGYETNNFNLDVVTFSYTSRFGWAGQASVGAKGNLMNGFFYMEEVSHELGHNYGLFHANLWRTVDGTPSGPGSNVEYGDCFDVMGACYGETQRLHFNARYKRVLDWLSDADVQTVSASGVYRIFAQDSSSSGIRALKIRKDDTKNYWVEFRQLFTGNSYAMNGAIIRWDYPRGNVSETQLLDMNPATTSRFDADAPLVIGQSFYDSDSQVRITVVGKGNTSPQSLDVRVELNGGTTPTPTPTVTPTPTSCTYSISPGSQNFGAAGGAGSINVLTTSNCSWSAGTSQNFVNILSGNSGAGNGTVSYSVGANIGASARSATISIAGQIFTVQQAAAPVSGNNYTLNASPSVIAAGGQITVTFTAPIGSSSLDWIGLYKVGTPNTAYLDGGYTRGLTSGVLNGYAPSEPGQYEFRYLLNDGYTSVANSNTISVQAAPVNCNYSITPVNQSYGAGGGTGNFNITTGNSCAWTAISNASWITVTGGNSGTGTGTINFTVLPNNNSFRTGTIVVGGQTFTVNQSGGSVAPSRTAFDFDGDGRADASVFRPSNGGWYLLNSTSGFSSLQFGVSTDKLAPADYDGDGRTDIAVFRNGTWYLQRSQSGFFALAFGNSTDIPMPADFDGDGRAEIAVFRPSNGGWYIYNLVNNQFNTMQFGQFGDIPEAADFDGDGKADVAVFRSGTWYIQRSRDGFTGFGFGQSGDKPIPADYDGDGKTDLAVFRPNDGTWYIQGSGNGFTAVQFGLPTDKLSPADYDGDGKADIAVFRDGTWYIQTTTAGLTGIEFGMTADKPISGAFIP